VFDTEIRHGRHAFGSPSIPLWECWAEDPSMSLSRWTIPITIPVNHP
jgi:hypothetical protein